jgi:thermitase
LLGGSVCLGYVMRVVVGTGLVVAVAAGVLVVGAPPSEAPEAAEPAELIVRFDPEATRVERREARDGAGAVFERRLPVDGMQVVEVPPGRPAAEAERALEADDDVLYAEPNAVRRAFLRPNDPYFGVLWAIENTGQSIRGTPGTPDADADIGEAWDASVRGETVVAVVDSGVDTSHPDLSAQIWRNPGESGLGRESNGLDDDANGRVDDWRGWDFVAGDNDPGDDNGHGTHVAGTIGAQRGNGTGVAGVAAGARIMPLRVLDANGSGRVSDLILAYSYAALKGARVVNLSLGSSTFSRAERDAIAAFSTTLFVAAAGNGGEDGVGDDNDVRGSYPCAYSLANVICVAASDHRDGLATFSNYGSTSVDLAAPGVSIASTWPGGGYSWSSGTSMATPHVSGAAALLWTANPNATVHDIDSAIRAGVDAAQAFANRTSTGGRLNVLRSLRLVSDVVLSAPAPAPPPSGSSAATPSSGGSSSAPGPAEVGDAMGPRLSLRPGLRQRLGEVLRRGLLVRVRCSEPCTPRVSLRRRGRSLALPVSLRLSASAGKRVRLRLNQAGRRALRHRRVLQLVARATDRAGNTRQLSMPLRLRR